MYFLILKTMKPTDFSKYLTNYISRYMVHERACSSNIIIAYTSKRHSVIGCQAIEELREIFIYLKV